MAQRNTIRVSNARLRGRDDLVDIVIADGHIVEIASTASRPAETVIDAAGSLITPSFVNPHLHLCKVWTLPMTDEAALAAYHGKGMSEALSAIDLAARVKVGYDAAWIIPQARRAAALAALHGNLHIRAFADVDGKAKLEGIKALLAVREEFRSIVEIEVVAFPQDGLQREPGAARLMEEAMNLGANIVGGIPWVEADDAAAQAHIDFCFDIAARHKAPISMLLDDVGNPSLRTLEMMARAAIARSWQGKALAHHCRAMALYADNDIPALIDLLRAANVSVVSDPHTGPLHARVKELLAGGVNVCLGQDDISDAYYPFGRNNLLEVGFLACHLLWMTGRQEIETVFDMITTRAAAAMGLSDHAIEVGAPANLVVLGVTDVVEAFRFHARPGAVISHGRLVDLDHMAAIASPFP